MSSRNLGLLALALALPTCSSIAGTSLIGEGRRVLFIGNSYLYYGDLPALVHALADSAGIELAVGSVTGPDLALIDHWKSGPARSEVRKGWEFVVLQQGPSAADLSRDTLRLATGYFAGEMAARGSRPALFSAWPRADRLQDFPRAIESYRLAAQDVNGILLPVAAAWLAAWERDPDLALYVDGLHPNTQGSYLSALVVVGRLLGISPVGLPALVRLRNGALVALDPGVAALLQEAAAAALAGAQPGLGSVPGWRGAREAVSTARAAGAIRN
jgi:hypothetical protein